MPCDLKNQEGFQPFYYDPRYEEAKNPFESGGPDINSYLQSIAWELGTRLNHEKMYSLKNVLEDKGFFHRNMGDESFRNEVKKIIKMARRVINGRSE
jgi:hypothetical protein